MREARGSRTTLIEENAKEKLEFDFGGPDVLVTVDDRQHLRARDDEVTMLRQSAGLLMADGSDERRRQAEALVSLANEKDRGAAPKDINYQARATKSLIRDLARAAFPKPDDIGRKDRAAYARWQRRLDFMAPDAAEVSLGDVGWLHRLLDKDKIGLPIDAAQWSEAVLEHVETLIDRTLARIAGVDPATVEAEA
jgi:hypothetical protein